MKAGQADNLAQAETAGSIWREMRGGAQAGNVDAASYGRHINGVTRFGLNSSIVDRDLHVCSFDVHRREPPSMWPLLA